jgi:hypothetical protein
VVPTLILETEDEANTIDDTIDKTIDDSIDSSNLDKYDARVVEAWRIHNKY